MADILDDFACFDLETVPHPNIPAACMPEFDETAVKLGNLKDTFKIRDKVEESRAAFQAGIVKKMSVDPDLCMIVAFVGFDKRSGDYIKIMAKNPEEEHWLVISAWAWIRDRYQAHTMFTGFNILTFDFPVLHRRAMLEDISVAPLMAQNLMRRQEYNRHSLDLMQLLGRMNPFSGKNDTISNLDYYLARYGLPGKTAHGEDVWPMFRAGEHQQILDYCVDDVKGETALFERVAPWVVVPRHELNEKPAIGEKGRM